MIRLGRLYLGRVFDVLAGEPETKRHCPGTGSDDAKIDLEPGNRIPHQVDDLITLAYPQPN